MSSDYRKSLQSMPQAKRRALYENEWRQPPKPVGLRSHGLFESRWIPPKGRFVSLEAKDESWARYFGLGSIETRQMELYDVRDWDNKLVGYSSYDPASCRQNRMLVAVLEDAEPFWSYRSDKCERTGRVKSIEVAIRRVSVCHESFVCWFIRIQDAEALARGGWLKCIGEDRIDDFVWDLQRRAYVTERRCRR